MLVHHEEIFPRLCKRERPAMKRRHAVFILSFAVLYLGIYSCTSVMTAEEAAQPSEPAYFLVQVQKEQFVLAVTQSRAIRDAVDCVEGRKRLIPTGEVAMGNGGFNTGWSWHLKPDTVRLVEVAMEVCDGIPSDVGKITSKYFCPWSARFVKRLPPPAR